MRPIIESELLMRASVFGMLACLAGSVLLPWISKVSGSGYRIRWTAALALTATCLFVVSHFTMPRKYNIRMDLLIFPLMILIAWVHCGIVAMISRASRSRENGLPTKRANEPTG
jgi:hypothetical protein